MSRWRQVLGIVAGVLLVLSAGAHSLLGGKAMQEELKLWNQALRHYRAQEWDQAEVALLNLSRMAPERGLYGKYMERVALLRKEPPVAEPS